MFLLGKLQDFYVHANKSKIAPLQCNYMVPFRGNMAMSLKSLWFRMLFSLLELVNVSFRLFRDDDRLLGRAFRIFPIDIY